MSRSAEGVQRGKRFPWGTAIGVLAAVGLVGVGVWTITGASQVSREHLIRVTVARGDLPIEITARGSLESQIETSIICEVESATNSRSSQAGTQIIFIVPNGSAVKEGDLLVELDSAAIREQLDAQILSHQQAVSDQIQANARYDNQITQNETAEAEAQLALDLARLEREMYEDEESGTYHLELESRERAIETAKNSVLESLANLSLQETELNGIKRLFELGYRGKGDLDESNYAFMRAEDALATATNNLTTAVAEREKLQKFEYQMQLLQLQGNVDSRMRSLEQVRRDNESTLEQVKAAKDAADQRLAKEKERMEKYEQQVSNCVIRAPHDGMVVWARARERSTTVEISEGAFVRERQEILTLPDLRQMQVRTSVHESVLNQVTPGQRVTVRIDAFPDRVYDGYVDSVAVLPDSGSRWQSTEAKMYETIVKIEGEVEQLKPGMTSVAEIHIDRLHDVITVPVQAIIEKGRQQWCYVLTENDLERRIIELGRNNETFVEIVSGVEPGEQVVINPMDIPEESQSQQNLIPEPSSPETMTAENQAPVRPVNTAALPGSPEREFAGRGMRGARRGGGGRRSFNPGAGPGRSGIGRRGRAAAEEESSSTSELIEAVAPRPTG